jgi:tripartite-type tricarboxylate transporter receptor subunit TctC
VRATVGAFAATMLLVGSWATAQDYPSRPVRLVNPYAPGGGVDIVARVVAQRLGETLGQAFVVDNRPGGGTAIGTHIVVRAPADGYTLLATTSALAMNAALARELPFDPVADLAPVALIVQAPNLLAVHPSVPVKNVQELIQLARAKPGQITYGSSGVGTPTHLQMELFKSLAQVDLLHVPYKGGGPSASALIGGEVNVGFITIAGILQHAQAGRSRVLAVGGAKRLEIAPDIPTVIEAGVPGFDVVVWFGLFAPARTNAAIVRRLNAEVNRALARSDVRDTFRTNDLIPLGGPPEALGNTLKSELARWKKVVAEARIVAH